MCMLAFQYISHSKGFPTKEVQKVHNTTNFHPFDMFLLQYLKQFICVICYQKNKTQVIMIDLQDPINDASEVQIRFLLLTSVNVVRNYIIFPLHCHQFSYLYFTQ